MLRFEALVEQFITASDQNELLFESDMVPYQARLTPHLLCVQISGTAGTWQWLPLTCAQGLSLHLFS